MEIVSIVLIIMPGVEQLHCVMLIQYYNFVVSINITKYTNLYRFSHAFPNTVLLIRSVNSFIMGILARLRAE